MMEFPYPHAYQVLFAVNPDSIIQVHILFNQDNLFPLMLRQRVTKERIMVKIRNGDSRRFSYEMVCTRVHLVYANLRVVELGSWLGMVVELRGWLGVTICIALG